MRFYARSVSLRKLFGAFLCDIYVTEKAVGCIFVRDLYRRESSRGFFVRDFGRLGFGAFICEGFSRIQSIQKLFGTFSYVCFRGEKFKTLTQWTRKLFLCLCAFITNVLEEWVLRVAFEQRPRRLHTHTHTYTHTHTHTHIYIYIYIYIKPGEFRLVTGTILKRGRRGIIP